jgi:thymidylate synthase
VNHSEDQYLDLLNTLLYAPPRGTRNDKASTSVFGRQMIFDLAKGFPLFTTKAVHFHSIVVELLWFLRGGTNTAWLHEHGVTIWDEWADEEGNLGPVYGRQWRDWNGVGIDQIDLLIEGLKTDHHGRRHIVTAWNPEEREAMALPPCHCFFQCYVENDGRLSLQLYQRSADIFLGVPFNVASYSLLLMMLARQVGLEPGRFIWTAGDVHLYSNHRKQALVQVSREPSAFPRVELRGTAERLEDWEPSDIVLLDYEHRGRLPAPVSR